MESINSVEVSLTKQTIRKRPLPHSPVILILQKIMKTLKVNLIIFGDNSNNSPLIPAT